MDQTERMCLEILDFEDGDLENVKVEVKLPDDYELATVRYMMQIASREAMKNQFMRVCVKRIGQDEVDWNKHDPGDMWNKIHVAIWHRLEKILLEHRIISLDQPDKEQTKIQGF